jgi:hypothetical protein
LRSNTATPWDPNRGPSSLPLLKVTRHPREGETVNGQTVVLVYRKDQEVTYRNQSGQLRTYRYQVVR